MALKKRTKSTGESQELKQVVREPQRNYQGFIEQLDDPDPMVRRWGARDLSGFPEAAGVLSDHLAHETDLSVREAILTSLATIATPEVVEKLILLLRSEDASLRNGVIEILQQLSDLVAPYMQRLLADADSDVRIFAIDILQSLSHPKTAIWLRDVLEHEDHVNVLATAIDRLVEVGDSTMLPLLEKIKSRFAHEPYLVFAADTVIRRLKEE